MKFLNKLFRTPDAKQLALVELQQAERDLLKSQAAAEYAASLSQYNNTRINRLRKFLREPDLNLA